MAAQSGYPYPDLSSPLIEAVHVVVDDEDQPVMAVAAQRIVELYLYGKPEPMHPALRLHAIRLIHDSLAAELRAKGYREANAFLPPGIAAKFGRRLERSFGWVKNWCSWCRTF